MKIFVGKLPMLTGEEELQKLFVQYGHVTSVYIRRESENGNNFYYGMVEMPVKKQALAAIKALNGKKYNGHLLIVHEARTGLKNRRHSGRGGGRRSYDPSDTEQ